MTHLDAISYGVIAGSAMVIFAAWLHVRRCTRSVKRTFSKPPVDMIVKAPPVRLPPPPVPTDPWDDDEATRIHVPGDKR